MQSLDVTPRRGRIVFGCGLVAIVVAGVATLLGSGLLEAQRPEDLVGLRHEASKVASIVGKKLSAFMNATEKARGRDHYEVDSTLFGSFASDLINQKKEIGLVLDAIKNKKLEIIKISPRTELGEIDKIRLKVALECKGCSYAAKAIDISTNPITNLDLLQVMSYRLGIIVELCNDHIKNGKMIRNEWTNLEHHLHLLRILADTYS